MSGQLIQSPPWKIIWVALIVGLEILLTGIQLMLLVTLSVKGFHSVQSQMATINITSKPIKHIDLMPFDPRPWSPR